MFQKRDEVDPRHVVRSVLLQTRPDVVPTAVGAVLDERQGHVLLRDRADSVVRVVLDEIRLVAGQAVAGEVQRLFRAVVAVRAKADGGGGGGGGGRAGHCGRQEVRGEVRGALRPRARVHRHGRGVHTRAEGRQAQDVETGRVETGGPAARAGGGQEPRRMRHQQSAGEVGRRRAHQRVHQLLAQRLAAARLSVRPCHHNQLQHGPVLVETHMAQETGQVSAVCRQITMCTKPLMVSFRSSRRIDP